MSSSGWLTPDEASAYLKVTKSTIYRWSEEGRLPFFDLVSGGGRRYKLADLDRMLNRGDDPQARHLRLAAGFRRVHDELDAMALDLESAQHDFSAGWDGLVWDPGHWSDIKQQTYLQSEAHREVAPLLASTSGRTPAQLLFDASVELALRNGHLIHGGATTATDAHASCMLCDSEITVGHPMEGGPPRVIVNSMATPCPNAAAPPSVQAPITDSPPGFPRPENSVESIRRGR